MGKQKKKFLKDVEESINKALVTQNRTIRLRHATGSEVRAEDAVTGTLSTAAVNLVKANLGRELCKRGHLQSFTCDVNKPGQMDFVFDVSGERVTVGLVFDF